MSLTKEKKFKKHRTWRHPRIWFRDFLRGWPFLVWVGIAALAAYLYVESAEFGGMSGVVQAKVEPVAPLQTARLVSTDVELGQRVKAGDPVCRMDISLLDARRAQGAYVLRATRDGVVSRILHLPGDVVAAGAPVVRLVSEQADHVVGFLPEAHLGGVTVGQQAKIWRQTRQGMMAAATVKAIGPEILALPGRLSPLQQRSLRGRRVILSIDGNHDLIPGETVEIWPAETTLESMRVGWRQVLDYWKGKFRERFPSSENQGSEPSE